MDKINTCYNINCIEFMQSCKEGMFDCIITDPPYSVGFDEKIQATDYVKREYEDVILDYDLLSSLFNKVLKENAYCLIWTGENQIKSWLTFMEAKGFKFNQMLIWIKDIATLSMSSYKISYGNENCLVFRKGIPSKINPKYRGKSNILKHKIVRANKFHPCQKPVNLLKDLVKIYTKENELIYDPFAGSGSLLIASKSLNRNSIGNEILEDYCNRINKELLLTTSEVEQVQKRLI